MGWNQLGLEASRIEHCRQIQQTAASLCLLAPKNLFDLSGLIVY
jgi:hypothetical protein